MSAASSSSCITFYEWALESPAVFGPHRFEGIQQQRHEMFQSSIATETATTSSSFTTNLVTTDTPIFKSSNVFNEPAIGRIITSEYNIYNLDTAKGDGENNSTIPLTTMTTKNTGFGSWGCHWFGAGADNDDDWIVGQFVTANLPSTMQEEDDDDDENNSGIITILGGSGKYSSRNWKGGSSSSSMILSFSDEFPEQTIIEHTICPASSASSEPYQEVDDDEEEESSCVTVYQHTTTNGSYSTIANENGMSFGTYFTK